MGQCQHGTGRQHPSEVAVGKGPGVGNTRVNNEPVPNFIFWHAEATNSFMRVNGISWKQPQGVEFIPLRSKAEQLKF